MLSINILALKMAVTILLFDMRSLTERNKVISLPVLKNIAPKRITGEIIVKFKLAPCSIYRTTP